MAAIAMWFSVAAAGQTTSFTYQGRLTENSVAAGGMFQMRFALFDASEAGSQVGTTIENPSVSVANGTFTVQLDFGSAFWKLEYERPTVMNT
jgi:hypothetical protein